MINILLKGSGEYLRLSSLTGVYGSPSYGGELNQTLLTGKTSIYPGKQFLYDLPMSDENGVLNFTQTIAEFSGAKEINGLTILFDVIGRCYPREFKIRLKHTSYPESNPGGVVITDAEVTVTANSPVVYVDISSNYVNFIEISINTITAPYSRFKLSNIYSGKIELLTSYDISECEIIEQIDITSQTLPFNTCDFAFRSSTSLEKIKNFKSIEVYHKTSLYGVFYIDKIEKIDSKIFKITSHDIIGELDKYTIDGNVYNPEGNAHAFNVATNIIKNIHNMAGLPSPSFPESSDEMPLLKGWLPRCDCREALRMVLQSVGWYADSTRSESIWYKKAADETISTQKRVAGINSAVNRDDAISNILAVSYKFFGTYEQEEEERERESFSYKQYGYGIGYNPIVIYPQNPLDYSRYFGSELLDKTTSNALYINGTSQWTISLTKFKSISEEYNTSSNLENTLKIDNTLFHTDYVKKRAGEVFSWYSKRDLFTGPIEKPIGVGSNVEISLGGTKNFKGVIFKLRYSLIGKEIFMEATARGTYNE